MEHHNTPPKGDRQPAGLDSGALWSSLTREPNTGVALLEPDGRVCYINQQSARIYFGDDVEPEAIIGKLVKDLFPPIWLEERQPIFDKVRGEGKPVLLRTIWRGRQHMAWIYPVRPGEDPSGPVTRLLILTRRISGNAADVPNGNNGFERINAEVIDLGALGALTPRELVVLALLGRGMSIKEVADHLYRSEKTIQTQRDSISRKLHLRNRAELVRMVQHVGLTVEDADRTNLDKRQGK